MTATVKRESEDAPCSFWRTYVASVEKFLHLVTAVLRASAIGAFISILMKVFDGAQRRAYFDVQAAIHFLQQVGVVRHYTACIENAILDCAKRPSFSTTVLRISIDGRVGDV